MLQNPMEQKTTHHCSSMQPDQANSTIYFLIGIKLTCNTEGLRHSWGYGINV